MLLLLGAGIQKFGGGQSSTRDAMMFLLFMASASAWFVAFSRILASRRACARRVRLAGYRFCPNCTYDLRTLPESGACPECGANFTPADLEGRWRQIYGNLLEPRYYGEFDPPGKR